MILFKSLDNEKDWTYIRKEVFMKEQGFQNEFDEIDQIALHITAYEDDKPIGCIRIYPQSQDYRIGRLAVLKEYRKLHIGSMLLKQAEQQIKQKGITLYLDAQCQAIPFYERNGYQCCGEPHLDEHVPHMEMKKTL